jgi:hypothetical protein
MRVYYRSPEIVITDEAVAIYGPVSMRFRLERIRDAHIVNEDPQPVRFISAGGIIVVPVLAIVAGSQLHSIWGKVIAVILAIVPMIVIGVRYFRAPRTSELRATYGDLEVTFFRSSNAAVFGQVRRALSRALDNRAPASA